MRSSRKMEPGPLFKMNPSDSEPLYFLVTTSPEAVRREKEKARKLRKTQWWQSRIAGGKCHYCGRRVPPRELTMDHVVPLIRGGCSTRGNVVPACKTCNTRKKYHVPLEWGDYADGLFKSTRPDEIPNTPEPGEENDGTM